MNVNKSQNEPCITWVDELNKRRTYKVLYVSWKPILIGRSGLDNTFAVFYNLILIS